MHLFYFFAAEVMKKRIFVLHWILRSDADDNAERAWMTVINTAIQKFIYILSIS